MVFPTWLMATALATVQIDPSLPIASPLSNRFSTQMPSELAIPAIAASPWYPVARINPNQSYTVQIQNNTGIVLDYASTTNEFAPRRLYPRNSSTVARLPLPVYLLISPINPRFNLKYSVVANKNTVIVTVTQLPNNTPGNTTVNIQETGGIFVY